MCSHAAVTKSMTNWLRSAHFSIVSFQSSRACLMRMFCMLKKKERKKTICERRCSVRTIYNFILKKKTCKVKIDVFAYLDRYLWSLGSYLHVVCSHSAVYTMVKSCKNFMKNSLCSFGKTSHYYDVCLFLNRKKKWVNWSRITSVKNKIHMQFVTYVGKYGFKGFAFYHAMNSTMQKSSL